MMSGITKNSVRKSAAANAPTPLLLTETAQSPCQHAAQKRMEAMQKEVDEVIGIMRMQFENKCVVSPDKRLSELYHLGPEYNPNWKCPGKENDGGKERERWVKIAKPVCTLFGLFLLILLIFIADYFVLSWVTFNEAETELSEAAIRKNLSFSTTDSTIIPSDLEVLTMGPPGSFRDDGDNSTDIVLVDLLDVTTAEGEDSNFPRGHDVLDPAEVDESNSSTHNPEASGLRPEEEEEDSLLATNSEDDNENNSREYNDYSSFYIT